jgi:hypothetical protein
MNIAQIITNAIPDVDEKGIDYIMWERTPYPCGSLTARDLYTIARRTQRAYFNKIRLCDFCNRKIDIKKETLCVNCSKKMNASLKADINT